MQSPPTRTNTRQYIDLTGNFIQRESYSYFQPVEMHPTLGSLSGIRKAFVHNLIY